MDEYIVLISFAEKHPLGTVLVILLLFSGSILSFKNIKFVQKSYNFLINLLPIVKQNIVIFEVFSKKFETTDEVTDKYTELGYRKFKMNFINQFNSDGSINYEILQTLVLKLTKKMSQAKKRMKKKDSFVYLGFPHIPLGFLSGFLFTDTNDVHLYEYDGGHGESKSKGFFELDKVYNTTIEIDDTTKKSEMFNEEVALKIEQSFNIKDQDIIDVLGDIQIFRLSVKQIGRWGISNYAQIDLYQKYFGELLQIFKDQGVKKIHIFATTPSTLSFSLGRVVNHYHPDILIYNYNNNKFDWLIDLKTSKVKLT